MAVPALIALSNIFSRKCTWLLFRPPSTYTVIWRHAVFGETGGLETYHISSCRFGISDTVMAENDYSPGCLIDAFDININLCQ